jgi:hypothetical protein
MPTIGTPGGVTPAASRPGAWISNSHSCSGIEKPSCGPVNRKAWPPAPRIAQAFDPPKIGGRPRPADAAAVLGSFRPRTKLVERLNAARSCARVRLGCEGNFPSEPGIVV